MTRPANQAWSFLRPPKLRGILNSAALNNDLLLSNNNYDIVISSSHADGFWASSHVVERNSWWSRKNIFVGCKIQYFLGRLSESSPSSVVFCQSFTNRSVILKSQRRGFVPKGGRAIIRGGVSLLQKLTEFSRYLSISLLYSMYWSWQTPCRTRRCLR